LSDRNSSAFSPRGASTPLSILLTRGSMAREYRRRDTCLYRRTGLAKLGASLALFSFPEPAGCSVVPRSASTTNHTENFRRDNVKLQHTRKTLAPAHNMWCSLAAQPYLLWSRSTVKPRSPACSRVQALLAAEGGASPKMYAKLLILLFSWRSRCHRSTLLPKWGGVAEAPAQRSLMPSASAERLNHSASHTRARAPVELSAQVR
jgi:hypothetical protein